LGPVLEEGTVKVGRPRSLDYDGFPTLVVSESRQRSAALRYELGIAKHLQLGLVSFDVHACLTLLRRLVSL
jgi:hypothetical protein